MDTFYDDFTSSLRSCAASRFYTSPLDRWSPQEIAAPERHRWLSEEKGDDEKWDDDAGTLDHQNAAFGLLESMLHIYFDPAEVEPLEGAETSEKEQVWLFAHHWLSLYYNFLLDTRAIHTEFYKQYHERFLAVLRKCLAVSSSTRFAFHDLVAEWKPSLETPRVGPTDAPFVLSASSPLPSAPPQSKRVVLQGPRGHNKTRKNLRN